MFRGPGASGIAEGHATPARWEPGSDGQVRWRVPVPGLGHASPVVWGDRIFVATAVGAGDGEPLKVGLYGDIEPVEDQATHRWLLCCFDKASGRLLWQRTAHQGVPAVKRHPKSSHANPTPATDGRHVVVFFGSAGLHCFDPDGTLLWRRDLGLLDSGYHRVPAAQWGFASSPVLFGDMVLVQCDVQKAGFLAAFGLADGRPLWRTQRDEVPTWSTPSVHAEDGLAQLIVNGHRRIGGYDVQTGRPLWWMRGGGDIPVPTPVVAQGLVFITSSHGASPVYAIRTDAAGDITLDGGATASRHVAWSVGEHGAYMQTPLVYRGLLHVCRDDGSLTCFEAPTGRVVYRHRLGEPGAAFSASPVAADGKIYFTSEAGDVHVLAAGPSFELRGVSPLGDVCLATPAISEGCLYFRTRGHLLAIGSRFAGGAAD